MAVNLPNNGDSILEYDIEQTNEINKVTNDTGWVKIGQIVEARRIGDIVQVRALSGSNPGSIPIGDNKQTAIVKLPQEFEPTGSQTTVPARHGGLQQDSFVTISEGGYVSIYAKGTPNTYWSFSMMYFARYKR